MYRVLIVEDEMFVRLGFKNSIPWDKYGMTVCADVTNGKEAWDYYNGNERPDVIITDLKMPQMGGMELIRKVRANDATTRIVILSCLEDFELVRQAMKMGVSNYILKLSMTDEEVERVLLQVREELGTQSSIEKSKGIIQNPDLLKENVIKNYMFYNLYSEAEFVRHISKLKLNLHPERLVVCMLEIDHFEQLQAKFKDEKGELIRATVLNVLNELLSQSQRGEVVTEEDKRYLFVFSFRDAMSELKIREELVGILTQIQGALKRFFNISSTVGISTMKNDYTSLHSLYRESLAAVEKKYFYGTGRLLFPQELNEIDADTLLKKQLLSLSEKWGSLKEAEQNELNTILQKFLESDHLRYQRDIAILFVRLLHCQAISAFLDEVEKASLAAAYNEKIQRCETLEETIGLFGSFLEDVGAMRSTKKQLSKEIARAVQFIQEHFSTDISLQQIADSLELTPNYLSSLFKKELDLTFTDYLNRIRLDKAKELLLKTNLKSYEIAEKVGFGDDSYFSRTFKKHVGVRPNQFRRLWIKDAVGDGE